MAVLSALLQVWMYWLAGIAIMTGIGVVIWHFSRPKPGPRAVRFDGQVIYVHSSAITEPGREFISAHPVGDHRLNHPGSDRWTGGDRKDEA